jgi:cytochrome c oxidase cbb3-type subunit II
MKGAHMASHKIEKSALLTIIGIILLFSTAVFVTLIAPRHVDSSWTTPSSVYQFQMYTVADPNFYISSTSTKGQSLEFVYHLKNDYTLLAFNENETFRIVAPTDLETYITKIGDPILRLTSRLLLLRPPQHNLSFNALRSAEALRKKLQEEWQLAHPHFEKEGLTMPRFTILELYDPQENDSFARVTTEGVLESWVDKNYLILDENTTQEYHKDSGVIYVKNPEEYRVSTYTFGKEMGWRYDPNGSKLESLAHLKAFPFGFRSREELIKEGEHLYAAEGCYYCHTDQTRTLVQDVVLNGSDSFPAPPSSANEYIFQEITFPGTRRIGPDLSRVGVKRPSRDWHKGHFWSPKTASKGSIMPAFKHFFDEDPSGKEKGISLGIPNHQFEALYQYLMTKGTRITPPTEAWWLGKDPVQTKLIIEGKK